MITGPGRAENRNQFPRFDLKRGIRYGGYRCFAFTVDFCQIFHFNGMHGFIHPTLPPVRPSAPSVYRQNWKLCR